MLFGVMWRVASCRVVSWLCFVVVSGAALRYVVVFTLPGVVWRCCVLWYVALRVGTWWAGRVKSIVVLLRCAVFSFVFLLRCAFCGAALYRGVWYCVLSRWGLGWRWVTPYFVVSCRVVSCGVVVCRVVVCCGVLPCGLLRCVVQLLVG